MSSTQSRRATVAILASLSIIGFLSVGSASARQNKSPSPVKSKRPESQSKSLKDLIHALKDSNPVVRRRAAEGLGDSLGDPEKKATGRTVVGTEKLISLNISGRAFQELSMLTPGIFSEAHEPPVSHAYGSIPITRLVTNLKSRNPIVRADSAKELGTREGLRETAINALIETARKDSYPAVRVACIRAIGNIYEHPEVLSALEQLLSDSDAAIRGQAADSLAYQLANSSRSGTTDRDVREAILQKLSSILEDSSPDVRRNAIKAIGSVGVESKRFAPRVVLSLRDQDSDVRFTALLNLKEINPDPTVVVAGLANALYDSKQQIRYETVLYLDSLGSAAAPAVPALNHVLSDDSKPIVLVAIKVLGQVGESAVDAVPTLINAMEIAGEGMRTNKGKNKSDTVRDTEDEKIRKASALAISNIATALEDAKRTDKIDVLEKAYSSLAKYDDSVMREYAKNVRRAIDDLAFRRRMRLLVILEDHPYWVLPILAAFLGVLTYAILTVLFLLAPVWEFSHRLLMNSYARNLMSLGTVYPLLMVSPPLRRYLLKRYLRTIRTESDFAQWEEQFVIPSENLLPEHVGSELVSNKKLLFVGPSGIGKTCFFEYLTFRHALKKNLKRGLLPKSVIPVFLPLERYHSVPVEKIFCARLLRFGRFTDETLSELFLKQGGFLVLIDGLNEVDEETRRRVNPFVDTYGNANYICASSQEAYAEFTWMKRINLFPLREEQVREVLRRRLGKEKADNTIQQFNGATFALYSVPQDLDFAIEVVKEGKQLPQSRPALYEAMLSPILGSWIKAGQADYPELLFSRAYQMLKSRSSSFEEADTLLPTEVRDQLVETKLLVRRGDRYQFRHDLVKAYLAAKYFAPRWSQLLGEEVIIESNWRPMLEFAILNLSSADHIEDLFNSLLKKNTQMAADLFGWLNQNQPTLCGDWAVNFKRRYADAILPNF